MYSYKFDSKHLEKDFHSIPEMNQAKVIFHDVKETKDRDGNQIWELTLYTDSFGIFDTYTYYNYRDLTEDLYKLDEIISESIAL